MAAESASEKSPITSYFTRLALKYRFGLKVLREGKFEVSGPKAKREGWAIGYRSIVEAAMVDTLKPLLKLSEEDTNLLVQSAFTHHATKRVQRGQGNISSKERKAIEDKSFQTLINLGIDPKVLEINTAIASPFKVAVAKGEIDTSTPEKKQTYRLQRIIAYIENCVDAEIDRKTDPNRPKYQWSDITDWRPRLEKAYAQYTVNASEMESVEGKQMSHAEIELMITGRIESELMQEIKKNNPKLAIPEGMPLWQFLRSRIFEDAAKTSV